jgi:hypothetical protein
VQIINNGVVPNTSGATISYIFWLTTTTPTACPACTSVLGTINAAQLAAIQAGTTVEQTGSFGVSVGQSPTAMNAQILALYAAAQSSISLGLSQYVGWCYNGSAWSSSCN